MKKGLQTVKRWLSVTLAAIMAMSLAACGGGGGNGGGNSGGGEGASMGRYIEENLSLPSGVRRIYDIFTDGAGLVCYGNDESGQIFRATLKTDGIWDVVTQDGLNDLVSGGGSLSSVSEAPDGTVMALIMSEIMAYSLMRSTDGGAFEEIAMEGWNENSLDGAFSSERIEAARSAGADSGRSLGGAGRAIVGAALSGSTGSDIAEPAPTEGADAPKQGEDQQSQNSGDFTFSTSGMNMEAMPMGVTAIDGGFLVWYASGTLKQYDADGVAIRDFSGGMRGPRVYGDKMVISDIYRREFVIYDLNTGKEVEAVPVREADAGANRPGTFSMLNNAAVAFDGDGIYTGDTDGIFRWNGAKWEMVVDGGLTSLVMANVTLATLIPWGDGEFYSVLESSQSQEIVRFTYDPDMPSAPDTTLEVFSLYDNSTVRQTIGEFQRKNPNVRVNLRIGMDGSGATVDDVIRALNTELLNGKGPDLIVLDGLPVDSYIEKGVLKDLTGLADKLVSSGNLMKNMSRTYAANNKVYGLPLRFKLPVMLGVGEWLEKINSLSDLARLVESEQDGDPAFLKSPSDVWGNEGIMTLYYEACAEDFINADGSINQEALSAYYADALSINNIIRANAPETGGVWVMSAMSIGGGGMEIIDMGAHEVASGSALVHLQTLSGVLGLVNICSRLSAMDGAAVVSMFNKNIYFPSGGIGVVSTGKQQELAQAFVEMALSPLVQDKYLYDGFPMSEGILSAMVQRTFEDMRLEDVDDMGFVELCRGLNNPVMANEIIKSAVASQVEGLISGSVTPEKAAAGVVESTWLYLAE